MGKDSSPAYTPGARFILLTDIYQSSHLTEEYPSQYASILDAYNATIEMVVKGHSGKIYKNLGDGFITFFDKAADSLACAVELQRRFAEFPAFGDDPFLVRVVAHGGELRAVGNEYFGPALNRASRICQVCHPGQVLTSATVALEAAGVLPETAELIDLGEHYLRDLSDEEHLFQIDHAGFSLRDFPPLPTLGNRPNNLVEQPNAFIGRRSDLATLKRMLLGGRRLVTITGPGGYGKSRLATHLCADMLEHFEQGVFFIELASLHHHSEIVSAVAAATKFRFYGTRPPGDQLIDFLRGKEALLCFDNFEHLLEGAALIGDVLRAAPRVKIVVTSREPLRTGAEQVYQLGPLSAGDTAGGATHADDLMLFTDRAMLANADFRLNEENLPGVIAACRRLDGIPLAIELAASWMDSFTVAELLDELDHQLELTARLSDVPQRHRSLRASLDWSWGLLSPDQQQLLMALSVFRNGCFAEAISAVTGKQGMALRRELSKLVDKSWVSTRDINGQTRFILRDTASYEYAQEKLLSAASDSLAASPALPTAFDDLRMAHAGYYSGLIAGLGPDLHGQHQSSAMQQIGLEIQNLNVAWDSLLDQVRRGDCGAEAVRLFLPMARWLWEYLDITSGHQAMVNSYEQLRETAGQLADQQLLFWSLQGCCQGHRQLGDSAKARELANQACVVARELGDTTAIAIAFHSLGVVEYMQSHYDVARGMYEESLAARRELGDRHGISLSLNNLGALKYIFGDSDAAREMYNESLEIKREIGDDSGAAVTLHNLGMIEYALGNLEQARCYYGESLLIKREIGDRSGIATTLNALGILERNTGNYTAARDAYRDALDLFREIGNRGGIAKSLNNLGSLEHNEGNYKKARRRYTESVAIFKEVGERSGTSFSLNALGVVECLQGNYHAARELINESLKSDRETGYQRGIGLSLANMGTVEFHLSNYLAARELYAESLMVRRDTGHKADICEVITAAGSLLATLGQLQPGAVCLYGAQHHGAELGLIFDALERRFLEQGLAKVEHPGDGLPLKLREESKAAAVELSVAELAEYALEALSRLQPGQETFETQ